MVRGSARQYGCGGRIAQQKWNRGVEPCRFQNTIPERIPITLAGSNARATQRFLIPKDFINTQCYEFRSGLYCSYDQPAYVSANRVVIQPLVSGLQMYHAA